MRISTNIPGLRAMNSASMAEKRMEQISRRLSSGIRINSSKDDPAGSAIANRLQAQSDATKIAGQNSMNAISVLQTADAALGEVQEMLKRMRELSVQAANGSLTSSDRLKIQLEIDQLNDEIDSFADRTDYNTTKLLNGHVGLKGKSANSKVLSISDNVQPGDYSITVNTAATAAVWTATGAAFPSPAPAGTLTINGIDIEISPEDTAKTAYQKLKEAADAVGISLTSSNNELPINSLVSDYYGASNGIEIQSDNPGLLAAFGLDASNYTPGTNADITLGAGFSDKARAALDGNRIVIADENNQRMVVELNKAGVNPPSTVSGQINITITDRPLVFQTGPDKDINMEVSIGEVTSASLGIDRISVATAEGAQRAIAALDSALSQCSSIRSRIGAYESRLEMISANLETSDMTIQTTLSKIFDTDMAYELAELSRNKIVAQGATSIMGQANQRPQSVLQLIK